MRALVLQHIDCEPAAVYEDELRARSADVTVVEVDVEGTVPDWRDFDLVVSMGGPMSVYDEAEVHWIGAEKRLISEAVANCRPVWGVCLGAQLLAGALGAKVYAGPVPEVGIMPVRLTDGAAGDPVFAIPGERGATLETLQWHGDTFDLPPHAALLASSPTYPNQAFRVGLSYGIQFHLEVSPDLARRWAEVPAYGAALDRVHGPGSLAQLIEDLEAAGPAMNATARQMFARWLDLLGEAESPHAVGVATRPGT